MLLFFTIISAINDNFWGEMMLKNRIIKLQQELNQQITNQGDYDTIYRLSLELDQLIVEFYRVKSA